LFIIISCLVATSAFAQQDFSKVQIETIPVAKGVYMLVGSDGNENIGKGGTIIVAHDNVRKRLAKGQFMKAFNVNIPPAPPKALPVITFADSVTFHWNNETLEVLHPKPAHTDGDAVIYFKSINVVHAGIAEFVERTVS
jgi:hypothetical protein